MPDTDEVTWPVVIDLAMPGRSGLRRARRLVAAPR